MQRGHASSAPTVLGPSILPFPHLYPTEKCLRKGEASGSIPCRGVACALALLLLIAACPSAGPHTATLGTNGGDVCPHLVPCVFAVDGDQVYSAVDGKPKTTRQLRRLANITARPGVSLLADHYDEDWARLWWVRADGDAVIVTSTAAMAGPLRLLTARYPQYRADPPAGPVIVITVHHWTGWTAAP